MTGLVGARSPSPVVVLIVVALAATVLSCGQSGRAAFPHALLTEANPKVLPPTELVGGAGRLSLPKDIQGKWVWVYFGYGSCPDICPRALEILAEEYKRLHSPAAVEVLFISVDPQRDKPDYLAMVATHYHPNFQAATGPLPTLKSLVTSLGGKFEVKSEKDGRYEVNHSDLVFIVDPDGRGAATYLPDPQAHGLSDDFNDFLANGQTRDQESPGPRPSSVHSSEADRLAANLQSAFGLHSRPVASAWLRMETEVGPFRGVQ